MVTKKKTADGWVKVKKPSGKSSKTIIAKQSSIVKKEDPLVRSIRAAVVAVAPARAAFKKKYTNANSTATEKQDAVFRLVNDIGHTGNTAASLRYDVAEELKKKNPAMYAKLPSSVTAFKKLIAQAFPEVSKVVAMTKDATVFVNDAVAKFKSDKLKTLFLEDKHNVHTTEQVDYLQMKIFDNLGIVVSKDAVRAAIKTALKTKRGV